MIDPYVIPGTTVLRNKLGLRAEADLDGAEADYAALWKIHAFREGNTRTTIHFCCQFADEKGFPIDRQLFEDNSHYVRTALVAYNAVFSDIGDRSKKEYLEEIIRDGIASGGEN
ncbi:MAG: hypothetical protein IJ646_04585 [Clostridia bacterium]|nr:hypothetical protein [Clostridia bacterium]